MSTRLRCRLRWHRWEQHTDPGVGGKQSVYFLCASCGREKMAWEPAGDGGIRGLAGGAG